MKTKLIVFLAMAFPGASSRLAGGEDELPVFSWRTDLETARKQALVQGAPLLVVFR